MHAARTQTSRRKVVCVHLALLLAVPLLGSGVARATDFPVSGTMTVNGNSGALPQGGTFGPSSYDMATGAIAAGTFSFPPTTTTFNSTFGPVVVTYQLSQTNTSSGQVAADAVAALTDAALKLQVTNATVSGFPVNVGTCVFQPINVALAGTGSASGLDLSATGFVIPQVGATDCGGYGSQINSAIAGSNNSMQVHLAGDFAPPSASDTIFKHGFDPPGAGQRIGPGQHTLGTTR